MLVPSPKVKQTIFSKAQVQKQIRNRAGQKNNPRNRKLDSLHKNEKGLVQWSERDMKYHSCPFEPAI